MTRDFSPVSKLGYIIILLAMIAMMARLSYGWSIDQTAVFTSAVTGGEFADESAWLIQLAPQAAFVIAGIALRKRQQRLAIATVVAGLAFNFLDAFTNIVTFQELWPGWSAGLQEIGRSARFVDMTYPVGLALAFAVTWFEEGIFLAVGTALALFVAFADEVGLRLPGFFRRFVTAAAKHAGAAGGNIGAGNHGNRRPERGHQPATAPQYAEPVRPYHNGGGGRR